MPNFDSSNSNPRTRSRKKPTTVAGVIVAILIGVYALLRPAINEATGWNLPAPVTETVAMEEPSLPKKPVVAPEKWTSGPIVADERKADTIAAAGRKPSGSATPEGLRPAAQKEARVAPEGLRPAAKKDNSLPAASELTYGLLRETQPDRFVSPAGLMYTPGGAEGHRLDHLMRHTEDQPNRPGKHGVFDGGMEKALVVIDQAYEKAKAGVRTTKSNEDGRTVYTVDMGKRVGYIGGREGGQKRNPMARRIRLVLDGNRVITAFPL